MVDYRPVNSKGFSVRSYRAFGRVSGYFTDTAAEARLAGRMP